MARQQSNDLELTSRRTVRTIEVAGEIPGGLANGASLTVRWERWEGRGTFDIESEPPEDHPRPDYELSLGFFGFGGRASWGVGKRNSEQCALLSGTDLNPQAIRGYATLLLELADKVEAAAEAEAAYFREHERIVRRRALKRA